MGLAIEQQSFSAEDYQRFLGQVRLDLEALQQLLRRDGFGEGPATIGAEVEYYIVNDRGDVRPINTDISAVVDDPLLTVELNRFNLEYNLSPQLLAGTPFLNSERELADAVARINQAAGPMDGRLVSIGILPTLKKKDFRAEMMTDRPRYHVLAKSLREQRGGPFRIRIGGRDRLELLTDDVTLEGANTSFQLHWRVPAWRFAQFYNAVQLVTPIVLGLAANSPGLFRKDLWDETRVALFTQSIDSRSPDMKAWRYPPRVYFGNGWLRQPWEAFASAVVLYPPLIPVVSNEDPMQVLAEGGVPQLESLKLHQGTTWPWNRAVYDHHAGGHLRIEMRALPAGPTAIDMSANSVFLMGAALAMVNDMERVAALMPFNYAEHNFYRSARFGLDADLIWPCIRGFEMRDRPLLDIAAELLPKAREALAHTGIDESELERLFGVMEGRLKSGISGARWQRAMVQRFRAQSTRKEAYRRMLQSYMRHSELGIPLHEWSLESD